MKTIAGLNYYFLGKQVESVALFCQYTNIVQTAGEISRCVCTFNRYTVAQSYEVKREKDNSDNVG